MLLLPDNPYVPSDDVYEHVPTIAGLDLCLRSYHARDRHAVLQLYRYGLLTGRVDPHDPATDLDHVEEVYLARPQDHFWVAEVNGHVIGSVAITEDDRQIAHVRRLRVDPAWKAEHGEEIARVMIQKATHHARSHDCLKLVLHTPVDDHQAIPLLHELGFEYARTRELGERHLLEFYLNLYAQPDRPVAREASHA